jgi:chromosome partitioning protein
LYFVRDKKFRCLLLRFRAPLQLIVPLPPNALDFASSAQFGRCSVWPATWVASAGLTKTFDFIHVLLMVPRRIGRSSASFGPGLRPPTLKLLPVEIRKPVSFFGLSEFGTVFINHDGNLKTLKRARDAYDRVADLIEQSIQSSWAGQDYRSVYRTTPSILLKDAHIPIKTSPAKRQPT